MAGFIYSTWFPYTSLFKTQAFLCLVGLWSVLHLPLLTRVSRVSIYGHCAAIVKISAVSYTLTEIMGENKHVGSLLFIWIITECKVKYKVFKPLFESIYFLQFLQFSFVIINSLSLICDVSFRSQFHLEVTEKKADGQVDRHLKITVYTGIYRRF